MEIPSFNALIQKSIVDHWDMDALTDYKARSFLGCERVTQSSL